MEHASPAAHLSSRKARVRGLIRRAGCVRTAWSRLARLAACGIAVPGFAHRLAVAAGLVDLVMDAPAQGAQRKPIDDRRERFVQHIADGPCPRHGARERRTVRRNAEPPLPAMAAHLVKLIVALPPEGARMVDADLFHTEPVQEGRGFRDILGMLIDHDQPGAHRDTLLDQCVEIAHGPRMACGRAGDGIVDLGPG